MPDADAGGSKNDLHAGIGILTRVSTESTASLEQGLLDRFGARANGPSSVVMNGGAMNGGAMMAGNNAMMGGPAMMKGKSATQDADLAVEGSLPSFAGGTEWLNSPPQTADGLKGKVVLVDFWTYSCINCLRAIPYVRAWADKYKDQGLVVIGVHAPEFAFEKNIKNVRSAVADLKIDYPVVDRQRLCDRSKKTREAIEDERAVKAVAAALSGYGLLLAPPRS